REQRLAGARGSNQEHALRHGAAEARVFLRLAQEIDDLLQVRLDLVDPRDVAERRGRLLGVIEPRAALTEAPEDPPAAGARSATREVQEPDHEKDGRPEA